MSKQENDDDFLDLPPILVHFCKAHAKTGIFTSTFDTHVTTNLAMISGLLGNMFKVELDSGFSVYPNMYSYIVGASGQGKSGYFRPCLSLIGNIQIEKNASYKKHKKANFIKKKELQEENRQRKISGKSSLMPQKEEYPDGVFANEYTLFTTDFTIEALQQMASVITGGNIFVVRDEFGGTLKLFKKSGRENDIPFLNEAYEEISPVYSVVRKMKEAKIPLITNICANIIGGIQLINLRKHFNHYSSDNGDGDGFFARFQNLSELNEIVVPKRPEKVDKAVTYYFEHLIKEIIELRVKHSKTPPEEHNPTKIKLTQDAEDEYYRYITEIHDKKKHVDNNILYREHLNKTTSFMLKVALDFHILEKPYDIPLEIFNAPIEFNTIKKAIKYVSKKLKIARKLYGVDELISSDMQESANHLYDYLNKEHTSFYKKYVQNGWNIGELVRTSVKVLPRKHNKCVDKERLESLIDYLVEEDKLFSLCIQGRQTKYSIIPFKETSVVEVRNKNDDSLPIIDNYQYIEVKEYPTKEEQYKHIETLKSSINIKQYIGQYIKLDHKGLGLCPFHDDKNPSFSVKNNYFKCFACDSKGSIIDFIMKYNNIGLNSAIKIIESHTGIYLAPKSIRLIDQMWEQAQDIGQYLTNRLKGETLPLNNSIRYSKSVVYKEGNYLAKYPAMLSRITNNKDEFIGLHRTYLNDDMSSKIDLGKMPSKKILERSDGGYINLIDKKENNTLIIGEGIETVLSLYVLLTSNFSILYRPNLTNISVYATISSTNIPRDLPARFTNIIIAEDNDIAGKQYSEVLRDLYNSRQVESLKSSVGNDFNDQLLSS